jgi:hypothetical protein
MPMLQIQHRLRENGRIRAGDQVKAGKGKAPRKLDHFRFTADDAQLLGIIADLYGGKVQPWPEAPSGEQYQVYTTADSIRVMIVPGLRPVSQWWEAWSGGGCLRRCDGQREHISGAACVCDAQGDRICKPTTRLQVILPDVPGLGTWRLETHGYYAAEELGGIMSLIERLVQATGDPVYGTLRLTQRTQKVAGQPVRHFAVPSLDVSVTVPELVERMGLAAAQPHSIDGANSDRVRALAEGHQPPPGGFLSPAEQEQAEGRAARKLERKRTPDMGPGLRGRDEPYTAADVAEVFSTPLSARQRTAIHTLFKLTGLEDRDDRLRFTAQIIGRAIQTSNDLTSAEAGQLIDVLQSIETGAAEYITDTNGRIIGAVTVDANASVLPLHDESFTLDPDKEND